LGVSQSKIRITDVVKTYQGDQVLVANYLPTSSQIFTF